MKRLLIVHPFLFLLSSLLFLYPFTAVIASPGQLIRPLVVSWVILAMPAIVLKRLLRDRHAVPILLTILVIGFFSSSMYFYVAGSVFVAVAVLSWGISYIRKRKFELSQFSALLSFASVLLVLLSTARMVPLAKQVSWGKYRQAALSLGNIPPVITVSSDIKPDIYYIVLDGYARSDILGELYGYDNSDLINYLEEKGFTLPAGSRSNYPKTALSVTSTLNMDYISKIAPGIEDSVFWWLMSPLIDHSQTRSILETAGYETVSIATDWSITDNQTTDQYFKPDPVHLNDFESYLLGATPLKLLKPLLDTFAFIPSFDEHGKLIKYNFTVLSEIPENPNPTFTFAHVVAPHPPFVFDQNGNKLHPDYPFSFNDANDFPGTEEQYRQSYVNQVKFVNSKLVQTIDAILEKSEVPPIIILQADHGPGMLTDFSSSENTCLKERFSVFAAYYLPGVDENEIPADLTAVNVFRMVFNKYFGANLPLLENQFYYYKDTIYIYRAENVTSQMDRECNNNR